ncbi:MAG: response regulator [Candidatus Cyclobacteriaceae bacterium M2_1C_046]
MINILIIDDEDEICALLSGMLRSQGYKVSAENTLTGGLESFQEGYFDLVFLDLNLPDGTGFDLIPKLKEINPDISVYIISAYSEPAERQMAISSGAKGFISKPFSRNDINYVLEKKALCTK